jgi:hypothetical protein
MPDAHPTLAGFSFLTETQFVRVFEHPELRMILAERIHGAPMPADDVESAHRELTTLAPNTAGWGLIIDTRQVSGNSDPRFEAAVSRVNAMLLAHFGRVVVLVRSAIGKLHATRLSQPSDALLVTTDPDEALAFLA